MNRSRRHWLRALPAAVSAPALSMPALALLARPAMGASAPTGRAPDGLARLEVQASDALAGFYEALVPAFERWWIAQGRGPVLVRTRFGAPGDGEPLPLATRMVLVVRRGNPRRVHGWSDLARADVHRVVADPTRSDEGRWARDAAEHWARAQAGAQAGAPEAARAFAQRAIGAADGSGRNALDARHAFALRGVGDVLITAEAEARALIGADGRGSLALVEPTDAPWVSPRVVLRDPADDPGSPVIEAFRVFHHIPAARALAVARGWRAAPGTAPQA